VIPSGGTSNDAIDLSARYDRQTLLPEIGSEGQQRLHEAIVLVVGCGALGCGVLDLLCRAGVGTLRFVDRDVVECSNLQRQVLFTERDIAQPKAIAAASRLAAVNSQVKLQPHAEHVSDANIDRLASGASLLIDGLDNFDTRYLLNDYAVREGIPYVYSGAVGTEGLVMPVLPRGASRRTVHWNSDSDTPCLRCVFPEPPPAGATPTCDTAGILGPTIAAVTAQQAALALSVLIGRIDELDRSMHAIDPWNGINRRIDPGAPRDACPCCDERRFEWLEDGRGGQAEVMCGRDVVQVVPPTSTTVDLAQIALRWTSLGDVQGDEHAVRIDLSEEDTRITLFADGRALVGVSDPAIARAMYDRYVGS